MFYANTLWQNNSKQIWINKDIINVINLLMIAANTEDFAEMKDPILT